MSDLETIDPLQQQLNAHRRTLAHLLKQQTYFDPGLVPSHVAHGIDDARVAIARLKADLRNRGVAVADQPSDISSPADVTPPRRAAWRPQDRAAMLTKVGYIWIDGVLKQSLWNDVLLALQLAEQPDDVVRPYGMRIGADSDGTLLPPGTTIQKVYDKQQGTLLVLGEPGSGKTTLLLDLAKTLLERAKQDLAHPIPVVFNLASWGQDRRPLAVWLVAQLHREYDVPRKIAQAWVDAGEVLPLLDGLDEVAAAQRLNCVDAINAYRAEHEAAWATPIVVCCRSAEYTALPNLRKLRLHGAIGVQPLTRLEINDFLYRGGQALADIREVVTKDPALYDLLQTPLILIVTILAFAGRSAAPLERRADPEARRRTIFAAYVERVFQPPPQGKGVDPHYSKARVLRWIAWLARQMRTRDQSIYWIEFMRPNWLPQRWMAWAVHIRHYWKVSE